MGLLDGGRAIIVFPQHVTKKAVHILHWSSGDAPQCAGRRGGSAATHKLWQKQPLLLHVICVWLLTGCQEEEKGLSVEWV